jgi:hypothetical protein
MNCIAQGAVLELSAGTGRNLAHYPLSQISSLTLTDLSQPMLKQVGRDASLWQAAAIHSVSLSARAVRSRQDPTAAQRDDTS